MREIIDSGNLGEVLQVTAHYPCRLSQNGSYLIDAVRYLAGGGKVEWVFGEIEPDEAAAGDLDVSGNGYLAFDNGVRAFLRTMSCGDSVGNLFEVIGEHGRIHCEERPASFEFIRFQRLEDRSLKLIAGESIGDDLPKRVRREMGLVPDAESLKVRSEHPALLAVVGRGVKGRKVELDPSSSCPRPAWREQGAVVTVGGRLTWVRADGYN